MIYAVIKSDELQHHGILGMHWGIRRFQNKDGSLTSAGRKRYGLKDVERDFDDAIEKNRDVYDSIKADGKKISSMADDLSEDYMNALKEVKLDSSTKSRIMKNLEEDFGSGCDDEEYYDMVLDDYIHDEVNESIGKAVANKREEFENIQDRYWNNISQLTSDIKNKYADAKISDAYINNGSMAVNKLIGEKFDTSWNSYISRHFDDYWVHDTDEYYSAIDRLKEQFPSMEEYNRLHK